MPWRRRWQPTPVSLPGKSQGQRSLVGCSPWGCKESGMTEHLTRAYLLSQFLLFASSPARPPPRALWLLSPALCLPNCSVCGLWTASPSSSALQFSFPLQQWKLKSGRPLLSVVKLPYVLPDSSSSLSVCGQWGSCGGRDASHRSAPLPLQFTPYSFCFLCSFPADQCLTSSGSSGRP